MATSAVSSIPRSTHPAESPSSRPAVEGGRLFVPPVAVLAASLAFQRRLIAWPEFRVWCACVEVQARREIAKHAGCDLAPFSVAHVVDALGREEVRMARVDVRTALENLQELGLVVTTKAGVHLPDDPSEVIDHGLRAAVTQWLGEVGQRADRRVGLPRRLFSLWRQQPRGFRIPVGVTVLLILRLMLRSRYDSYSGCATSALLQRFSGGCSRSVRRAVSELVANGVVERVKGEWSQRQCQRYGGLFRLNPQLLAPDRGQDCGEVGEMSAPSCGKVREMSAPFLKPAAPDSPVKRNQVPEATAGAFQRQSKGVPTWERIEIEHLRDAQSLATLHRLAAERGLVANTVAGRRHVVEQAQRVLRRRLGTQGNTGRVRNAPALFRWSLEHPDQVRAGSAADEAAATPLLESMPPLGGGQEWGDLTETPGEGLMEEAERWEGETPVDMAVEIGVTPAESDKLRREVVRKRMAREGPRRRRHLFEVMAEQRFLAVGQVQGVSAAVAAVERFARVWRATYGEVPNLYPWEWSVGALHRGESWPAAACG